MVAKKPAPPKCGNCGAKLAEHQRAAPPWPSLCDACARSNQSVLLPRRS